ncbi:MAG: pyridoxamine 5'-phosphate oxidase family protein [Actinomycetota bacterium]|nr:pyridoxamine 5'-phosphate oxidase family protein [Actinomycetota bacterium]
MRAVPVIIPVRFILFGEDVVFSPGPGTGLSRAIEDAVVAFETDGIGDDGRPPWDVHVTGVARTFSQAPDALGFRLSAEIMTGWQVFENGF